MSLGRAHLPLLPSRLPCMMLLRSEREVCAMVTPQVRQRVGPCPQHRAGCLLGEWEESSRDPHRKDSAWASTSQWWLESWNRGS